MMNRNEIVTLTEMHNQSATYFNTRQNIQQHFKILK